MSRRNDQVTKAYVDNGFRPGEGYQRWERTPVKMKDDDRKPLRPYEFAKRDLIPLPPKTIIKRPELLPPYTNVSINQSEEAIDLDELRAYGRYVILSYDEDYRVKALISNNVSAPVEIDNPDYIEVVAQNKVIEASNTRQLEQYNANMVEYKRQLEEYNKKHGTQISDDGPEEVKQHEGAMKKIDGLSSWNEWNEYAAEKIPAYPKKRYASKSHSKSAAMLSKMEIGGKAAKHPTSGFIVLDSLHISEKAEAEDEEE